MIKRKSQLTVNAKHANNWLLLHHAINDYCSSHVTLHIQPRKRAASSSRVMESRKECPHEEKVLQTLASIKSQVSSVLKNLQEARESAAESVCTQTASMDGTQIPVSSTPNFVSTPLSAESPASRDEVKAQREAKKAAKAARKSQPSKTEIPPGTPPVIISATSSVKKPEDSSKSKAELKAQRRSIQEAQREAKAKGNTPQKPVISSSDSSEKKIASQKPLILSSDSPVDSPKSSDSPKKKIASPKNIVEKCETKTEENSASITTKETSESPEKIQVEEKIEDTADNSGSQPSTDMGRIHGLFRWDTDVTALADKKNRNEFTDVDPMFKELGLLYSADKIRGSNRRTVALLQAVKKFVRGYRTPEGKGFKHDISSRLKNAFDWLKLSRPFAIGMITAIDGLNEAIRRLEEAQGQSDEDYRNSLEDWCETFIEEKVEKALEAIAQKGCEKIEDGDTILVFSLTEVIFRVFKFGGDQGKKFSLILATTNSDCYLKDYEQLRKNIGPEVFKKNVLVSCINISSIMNVIPSVNKVFLGGHALFTTGGVMAHAGSSTIALCAMQYNIPTLFFCETYKFCDKSPTDAFYQDVFFENKIYFAPNRKEIDDDLNSSFSTSTKDKVIIAKIRYDFTPVNLVTCVITDIDMLPSSSVPVVLRVQETRPLTKCL